ncbi:hypothetical protein BDZ89DRAFT_1073424 [Hymenopellis radicata]|nr:hypothetical protein BDZ89DRAFT_1073424 [Hymenopellis radicata]
MGCTRGTSQYYIKGGSLGCVPLDTLGAKASQSCGIGVGHIICGDPSNSGRQEAENCVK